MAIRTAGFVALLALAVPCAMAQAPLPDLSGGNGTFSGFTAAQYKYSFTLPDKGASKLEANSAPAVAAAGLTSRLFALGPCQLFAPHFHPGAAEYFLGVQGKINLVAYVNGQLVRNTIKFNDAVIVPRNTFHYFYNNKCSNSAAIASLNSAAPGFQGYYVLPEAITDLEADAKDIGELIASTPANATLDVTRAFIALTNECARTCPRKFGLGAGVKINKKGIKIGFFGR